MKTTLDLPDELVRRMKIRAVHEGRPLKRLAADLLTQALDAPDGSSSKRTPLPEGLEVNAQGYPLFRCAKGAPSQPMTAAQLIALEQEILEGEDMQRAGLPL